MFYAGLTLKSTRTQDFIGTLGSATATNGDVAVFDAPLAFVTGLMSHSDLLCISSIAGLLLNFRGCAGGK